MTSADVSRAEREGDCYTCHQTVAADAGSTPARENIAGDASWRVAHAFGSALPGWLVLVPRRHVEAIADLTDAEAAALGSWLHRLSVALREETGCVKTYVLQLAEAEGFAHVHFHVVPRLPDMRADRVGPQVFGYLADPAAAIPEAEQDALGARLSRRLG